ncbi:hypothetical protein GCM10010219_11890 [Streptomyces netropsis]|nr:hypothetical protein GCM10010219_11890 [Streptomyces netropsis]
MIFNALDSGSPTGVAPPRMSTKSEYLPPPRIRSGGGCEADRKAGRRGRDGELWPDFPAILDHG